MTTTIETKLREIVARSQLAWDDTSGINMGDILFEDVPKLVHALRRALEDNPQEYLNANAADLALADIEAILEGT